MSSIGSDTVGSPLECPAIPPLEPTSPTFLVLEKLCDSVRDLPGGIRERFRKLVWDHDIWNAGDRPLSVTNMLSFKVEIKPGTQPIKSRPRDMPLEKRFRLKVALEDMEKKGIIAKRPSRWASPVDLVPVLENPAAFRMTTDFRRVNQVTQAPQWFLPFVSTAIDTMRGKKYFSTIHMTNVYWQIPVEPDSRKYLAFTTTEGIYQWLRMPFGAAGAPATMQQLGDRLLGDLNWKNALLYLDLVVIFSDSEEEHVSHIEAFLQRVAEARLQLMPQRCAFFTQELKFFGHILTPTEYKMDLEFISAAMANIALAK